MRSRWICINGSIRLSSMIAANLNDRVVEAAPLVEKRRRAAVVLERQQAAGMPRACVSALSSSPMCRAARFAISPTSASSTIRLSRTSSARHRAHIGAAMARQRQHALGGQTFEGLAYRSAAHMVIAREIGFDQSLARHIDAGPDASDDRIDDAVGRSHLRGSPASTPLCLPVARRLAGDVTVSILVTSRACPASSKTHESHFRSSRLYAASQ